LKAYQLDAEHRGALMLALCNDCNIEEYEDEDENAGAATTSTGVDLSTPVRPQADGNAANSTPVQTPNSSRKAVMPSLIASLQPRTPVALNLSKAREGDAEDNGLFCEGR
jgi:hypothetical protein